VAFWYAPEYFERLAADAGMHGAAGVFTVPRLPPLRLWSPLIADAAAGAIGSADVAWEELGVNLAARAVTAAAGRGRHRTPPNAVARVTRTLRTIERQPDAALTLGRLAREAHLSPYHFLRTFEELTGVTPHQYVMRSRLRDAAIRLAVEPGKVLDIALDSGFGDVSNFNRAFRTEFGVSPVAYRKRLR
jgi:AraC-like DNA-binding protein